MLFSGYKNSSIKLANYISGVQFSNTVNWLGFDRFGKIIYGYFWCDDNNIVFLKFCPFVRRMTEFKRITFKNDVRQLYHCTTFLNQQAKLSNTAITNNGEFIGIVTNTCNSKENFLFCLFELETGTTRTFNVSLNSTEHERRQMKCLCECLSIFSNANNKWISKIVMITETKIISKYFELILDESSSNVFLSFVTEHESEYSYPVMNDELFLEDKMIVIKQANGIFTCMSVFNFISRQWIAINVSDWTVPPLSMLNFYTYDRYKVFFDSDKNLCAVSEGSEEGVLLRYSYTNNTWRDLNVNKGLHFSRIEKTVAFATPTFYVFIENKYCSEYSPAHDMFASVITLNKVLSLRDSCIMKIFEPCGRPLDCLTLEEVLKCDIYSKLPQYLKRMYLGPQYNKVEEIINVTCGI